MVPATGSLPMQLLDGFAIVSVFFEFQL